MSDLYIKKFVAFARTGVLNTVAGDIGAVEEAFHVICGDVVVFGKDNV